MVTLREWLFRVLVLATAGLMLVSVILPWWTAEVNSEASTPSGITSFTVNLYQYGIPKGFGASFFILDVTPRYQTVVALSYIGVSICFMLLSTWSRRRQSRWLLGGIGLGYIAYCVATLVLISIRVKNYDISIQGNTYLDQMLAHVNTKFQTGYYLAYGAGFLCIILAGLKEVILGKKQSQKQRIS